MVSKAAISPKAMEPTDLAKFWEKPAATENGHVPGCKSNPGTEHRDPILLLFSFPSA